jgi:dethiobiotin synthetase
MKSLFITSSGTEIGKTLVTAALCHQLTARGLKVQALKPVVSDFNDGDLETDTAVLLHALGQSATAENIDAMSPWRFQAPLSPDMAAAREDRKVDFEALIAHCEAATRQLDDVLLIEGVGGVMVPLNADKMVRDWMAALGMPAILVVGSYLGSISHTLSAVEALRAGGIPVKAVVISTSDESPVPVEETAETLSRFLGPVPIAILPRLTGNATTRWRNAPDLTGLVLGDEARDIP